MNLGTNLLIAYIIISISTYYKFIFNKSVRQAHQQTRKELEILRKKSYKTHAEQLNFLDLKYPKSKPFVWSLINILKFIYKIGIMIILFISFKYLWRNYLGIEFALWQTMLIMVILPIFINLILKKYNLHQDDILIHLK